MRAGSAAAVVLVGTLLLAAGCSPGADGPRDRMRPGMMMQRMMGDMPDGIAADELPDRDSRGADLFAGTCTQCHALPDPARHPPDAWADIVDRMRRNMRAAGAETISEGEADTIVRYLERAAEASGAPRQRRRRAHGHCPGGGMP